MKPETMTVEHMEHLLNLLALNGCRSIGEEFTAHIAALTAERDEARRIHAANVEAGIELAKEFNRAGGIGHEVDGVFVRARALLMKVDALRERVQALEKEVRRLADEMAGWRDRFRALDAEHTQVVLDRLGPAERDLAAIRQRAGDTVHLMMVFQGRDGMDAVARYVLGEGATGAGDVCPEPACGTDGGEHSLACPRAVPEVAATAAPEPTTAEAFATVRKDLDTCNEPHLDAETSLSLLERRMGAMVNAIRLVATFDAERQIEHRWGDAIHDALRSALTDATPVFTLEEVEAMERIACECPWRVEATREDKHAPGCAGGRVREAIAALRK